jgi:hypothetical protein
MSTNYFGEGLRDKLAEFKLKYEAFAKDAGISGNARLPERKHQVM